MGLWLLGLFIVGLLFYGTYLIIKARKVQVLPVLYIVVRNQADTIEGILRQLVKGIRKTGFPGQVIVIDDYSGDETVEILKRLGQEFDFIVQQTHAEREGQNYEIEYEGALVYRFSLGPQSSYKAGIKAVKGFFRHYEVTDHKSKVISKA